MDLIFRYRLMDWNSTASMRAKARMTSRPTRDATDAEDSNLLTSFSLFGSEDHDGERAGPPVSRDRVVLDQHHAIRGCVAAGRDATLRRCRRCRVSATGSRWQWTW